MAELTLTDEDYVQLSRRMGHSRWEGIKQCVEAVGVYYAAMQLLSRSLLIFCAKGRFNLFRAVELKELVRYLQAKGHVVDRGTHCRTRATFVSLLKTVFGYPPPGPVAPRSIAPRPTPPDPGSTLKRALAPRSNVHVSSLAAAGLQRVQPPPTIPKPSKRAPVPCNQYSRCKFA